MTCAIVVNSRGPGLWLPSSLSYRLLTVAWDHSLCSMSLQLSVAPRGFDLPQTGIIEQWSSAPRSSYIHACNLFYPLNVNDSYVVCLLLYPLLKPINHHQLTVHQLFSALKQGPAMVEWHLEILNVMLFRVFQHTSPNFTLEQMRFHDYVASHKQARYFTLKKTMQNGTKK